MKVLFIILTILKDSFSFVLLIISLELFKVIDNAIEKFKMIFSLFDIMLDFLILLTKFRPVSLFCFKDNFRREIKKIEKNNIEIVKNRIIIFYF